MKYRRPRPRFPVANPDLFRHAGCVVAYHHPSRKWAVWRGGVCLGAAVSATEAKKIADMAQLAQQRKE